MDTYKKPTRFIFILLVIIVILAIILVVLGLTSERAASPVLDADQRAAEAAVFLDEASRNDVSEEERVAASEYLEVMTPGEPDIERIEQINDLIN